MAGITYTSSSVPTGIVSFNGGLNSSSGPFGLKNNESSDLQNIDFDKFGSILKRNGYTTANNIALTGTNNNCDGLHWYELDYTGTNTRYLINVTSGYFYKMDDLDKTFDMINSGLVYQPAYHCDFENFLNECYITNGYNIPLKITSDTSTMTNAGTFTNMNWAKYNRQYNNYLFYGNVKVNSQYYPSRIHWSNYKNTGTWTATDFIDISRDDGQEITGLKVLQDRLVVFKTRSIYNVFFTGDADVPFVLPGGGKSNSAVGCVAPWSIQEVDNGLVFFSYDGFYFYDGANSYKLSDKVTKTILEFNETKFSNIVSLNQKSKNRYMASFASSGQTNNDRVMIWDYFHNAWSKYVNISANAMTSIYVDGLEERPYFADYDGFTYRFDYGDNDTPIGTTTAVNGYYYTNWIPFDDIVNVKGIPNITMFARTENSTITFAYSYDFEEGDQYSTTISLATSAYVYDDAGSVYGTATYGGEGGTVVRRDLTGRGRVVRFKFANNNSGEQFRIDGLGMLPHLETKI